MVSIGRSFNKKENWEVHMGLIAFAVATLTLLVHKFHLITCVRKCFITVLSLLQEIPCSKLCCMTSYGRKVK